MLPLLIVAQRSGNIAIVKHTKGERSGGKFSKNNGGSGDKENNYLMMEVINDDIPTLRGWFLKVCFIITICMMLQNM